MLAATMRFTVSLALVALVALVALASLTSAMPVVAQDHGTTESLDVEARALFTAGSTAFEDTRYGDALVHFQRAYELSQRSVLLYNVGVSADRVRRDAVALAAFERFLREVPVHPRRREVEARVVVLRASVAASAQPLPTPPTPSGGAATGATGGDAVDENATTANAGGGTAARSERTRDAAESDGPSALSIAGPITLGALGVAGVVAAIVGLSGGGECLALEGAVCVEERQTNWVGVGLYGGLGLASLAGALIWMIVAMSGDGDTSNDTVALTPNGLAVRWSL